MDTNKQLYVIVTSEPIVMVTKDELDELLGLLDEKKVSYTVETK
ncbi:hypothetical protein [Scytonema sp. NUACC26]